MIYDFVGEVGRRLKVRLLEMYGDGFLVSQTVVMQRFNSVLIHETFANLDHEPDY